MVCLLDFRPAYTYNGLFQWCFNYKTPVFKMPLYFVCVRVLLRTAPIYTSLALNCKGKIHLISSSPPNKKKRTLYPSFLNITSTVSKGRGGGAVLSFSKGEIMMQWLTLIPEQTELESVRNTEGNGLMKAARLLVPWGKFHSSTNLK